MAYQIVSWASPHIADAAADSVARRQQDAHLHFGASPKLGHLQSHKGVSRRYARYTTDLSQHTLSIPMQLSTYVSFWTADKFGRRALFLQAGVQMSAALLVIAVSLKCLGGGQGTWLAWYILAMTCVYDM